MGDLSTGDWLDTETKACLQQAPPSKLAPSATETFSLVILRRDPLTERRRQGQAFERVLGVSLGDAKHLTTAPLPFILKRGLTLSDAMLGQFELICSDIVSVFLSDEVTLSADPRYLADLYRDLLDSDEFAMVTVSITAIPPGESGRKFVRRFIADTAPPLPHPMRATRKKARIMCHWAKKLGGMVSAGE
ncbi:MAG: hypothetical protein RBS80_16130 [Thermoguttaceae bacterium]|jgi:hypothetical protein|nr:hypothetical protein [Thermoguttaceae bacterium]